MSVEPQQPNDAAARIAELERQLAEAQSQSGKGRRTLPQLREATDKILANILQGAHGDLIKLVQDNGPSFRAVIASDLHKLLLLLARKENKQEPSPEETLRNYQLSYLQGVVNALEILLQKARKDQRIISNGGTIVQKGVREWLECKKKTPEQKAAETAARKIKKAKSSPVNSEDKDVVIVRVVPSKSPQSVPAAQPDVEIDLVEEPDNDDNEDGEPEWVNGDPDSSDEEAMRRVAAAWSQKYLDTVNNTGKRERDDGNNQPKSYPTSERSEMRSLAEQAHANSFWGTF